MPGFIIVRPATTRGGLLFGRPIHWLKGRFSWRQHVAIPPAAAERLEQSRRVGKPRSPGLHHLDDGLLIGGLRVEQQQHVGVAALHLLPREIETILAARSKSRAALSASASFCSARSASTTFCTAPMTVPHIKGGRSRRALALRKVRVHYLSLGGRHCHNSAQARPNALAAMCPSRFGRAFSAPLTAKVGGNLIDRSWSLNKSASPIATAAAERPPPNALQETLPCKRH
jgi:hypothetical protein